MSITLVALSLMYIFRFLGLISATSLVTSCTEGISLMTGTEGSVERTSVNT